MAYGIRLYDETGTKVTYDSTMVTWNQVNSFISYNSSNHTYPLVYPKFVNEAILMLFFVNAPPIDRAATLPTFGFTNTSVSVTYTQFTNANTGITSALEESVIGLVLAR